LTVADALSARRAGRLAVRAAGPHGGARGWLARRAWRALLAAGDAGDRHAIEAVWSLWLWREPPHAWEALMRWRPGQATRELCEMVVSPTMSEPTRARLGAFCIAQGLTPADPVERVVFHLLTGQFGKVHDEDPDGVLVAAGYRAAPPQVRAMLRAAFTADGDVDLPLILIDANETGSLGDDETELLLGHLAATGEWDRLWRLTTELPVRAAVAAVRRFDDWRPADHAGRALFERLGRADPDVIATAERELRATAAHITVMTDLRAAAFAPDGRSIVLASTDGRWMVDRVRRVSLPGGDLITAWPVALWEGALLDLGGIVVAEDHDRFQLDVLSTKGRRTLPTPKAHGPVGNGMNQRPPVPAGDGFVTTVDGRELLVATGRPLTLRRIPALRLPPPRWSACLPVAADPGSGRLAVRGHRNLAVLSPRLRPLAWTDDTAGVREAAFLGPDRLVTSDDLRLTRWQVEGRRLVPEATGPEVGLLTHVTVLRDRGQVLAVGPRTSAYRTRLMLFDAESLRPAGELPGLLDRPASCVWAAQDGGRIVFCDRDGSAHVHDLISESVLDALTRPAVRLTPVDAERLDDARRRATGRTGTEASRRAYSPAVHEAMDVLAAALRFRSRCTM
jgi:hypothetical protein